MVNREILKNDPVNTDLMSIEDAMRSGAMALFGEKYGSTVRVLSVGGGEFSKELCGGTHVRATGDIGSFKIMSDEAVASGVRRIRAITGIDAFERFREDEKLIAEAVQIAKAQRDNLPSAIEKLQEELKKARRENDELKMKIATGAIGGASSNGDEAKDINGVKVIAKTVDGLDKGGMRHLSDTLMAKIKSGVVIVAKAEDDKVSFIVRVSDDLTTKSFSRKNRPGNRANRQRSRRRQTRYGGRRRHGRIEIARRFGSELRRNRRNVRLKFSRITFKIMVNCSNHKEIYTIINSDRHGLKMLTQDYEF